MKLSEIKGEETIDIIAELIVPIANIAVDPVSSKMFKKVTVPEDTDVKELAVKRIKEGLPALLKTHKKDLIKILATLGRTTEEEYEKSLTLPKLIVDVTELVTDEVFLELF